MADISGVLLCVRLCARPFSCAILSNQCDTCLAIFILILQMRVLRFEKAKSLAQRYRPVKSMCQNLPPRSVWVLSLCWLPLGILPASLLEVSQSEKQGERVIK